MKPTTALRKDYERLLTAHGLPIPKYRDRRALYKRLKQRASAGNTLASLTLEAAQLTLDAADTTRDEYFSLKSPVLDVTGDLSPALSSLMASLAKFRIKIPETMLYGVYPTGVFNACVMPTTRGVLCLLNTGLIQLVFRYAVAVMFAFDTGTSTGRLDRRGVVVGLLASATARYRRGEMSTPVLPGTINVTPRHLQLANMLTLLVKAFVLAHEIGHVVLGHVSRVATWDPLSEPRLLHLGASKSSKQRHQQEFDADSWAMDLLKKISVQSRSAWAIASIVGLKFLQMESLIVAKLDGTTPTFDDASESHPSTADRIARLRASTSLSTMEKETLAAIDDCIDLIIRARITYSNKAWHISFSDDDPSY